MWQARPGILNPTTLASCVLLLVAAMATQGSSLEPELFAEGVISTPGAFAVTFAPDGRTVYFAKAAREAGKPTCLMVSRLRDGTWTAPERLAFSGEHGDFDPFLSPDGSRLFFASVRPLEGRKGPALWTADKADGGWGAPRALGAITGPDGVAVFPSVAANGNLYFAGHRSGLASLGNDDIYRCRPLGGGRYGEPENLGPAVNSPQQDYDAYVAPDESFLIFASRRPGGVGDSSFYLSLSKDGAWTQARLLGSSVNWPNPNGVCCPAVSPDRKYFYFNSARDGKRGIFRIALAALGLDTSQTAP